MSKTITIGKSEFGRNVTLDVGRLIASRLLVTATSGGGKSWLLRKILEEVSASAQTIVIDPEGEFASLREIRDMILVGSDGDLPADPRSAGLLCRRLMEMKVSAVLDIYELTPAHRREFVAKFLSELVNLPKSLWHNCFIAIDEVHEFAPNTKDKEYVSGEPVGLLFSKGRKRGFGAIIATQRLSKLSMDVAAEAKNRFIGQTSLDIDQKRAADFLGWGKDRWADLRDLSPPKKEGEFFAVGPALNQRGVIKLRSGMVKTSHPEAGQGRMVEPPAPSKKISGVLSELRDLPQQAEAEIRDMTAAKAKISSLERELRQQARQSNQPQPAPAIADKTLASRARQDAASIAKLKQGLEQAMKIIAEINTHGFDGAGIDPEVVKKAVQSAADQIVKAAQQTMSQRQSEFERLKKDANKILLQLQKLLNNENVNLKVDVKHNEPFTVSPPPRAPRGKPAQHTDGESGELSKTAARILDTILMLEARGIVADRESVARWMGLHPNGGRYGRDLARLRAEGYLDGFVLTESGRGTARATETGYEAALAALDATKSRLLQTIVEAKAVLSRDELAERLGLHPNGGRYGRDLAWLRQMKVIPDRGDISAAEGVFR